VTACVSAPQAVMAHIERLLDAGLAAEHIGVITPYNGQVAALRELRGDKMSAVEISSVDGFQGREAEALHMLTTWQHMGFFQLCWPAYALMTSADSLLLYTHCLNSLFCRASRPCLHGAQCVALTAH